MEGHFRRIDGRQSFYDKVDSAERARFLRQCLLQFLSLVSLPHTVARVPGRVSVIVGRVSGCWNGECKASSIEE